MVDVEESTGFGYGYGGYGGHGADIEVMGRPGATATPGEGIVWISKMVFFTSSDSFFNK